MQSKIPGYIIPDFYVMQACHQKNTKILITDLDSVSAAGKYCNAGKTALLNFASYKHPGGGFIIGSVAQEECLCHVSYLYNVLREFESSFYDWNREHMNRNLYLNRALYSPDILFKDASQDPETEFYVDVITCAAPNKSASQKYHNVSDQENAAILRSRIQFILDIAKDNKINTLILGAYGCGAFGQDGAETANIFKECLKDYNCFDQIIFAIPAGRNGNLKAFQKVFG